MFFTLLSVLPGLAGRNSDHLPTLLSSMPLCLINAASPQAYLYSVSVKPFPTNEFFLLKNQFLKKKSEQDESSMIVKKGFKVVQTFFPLTSYGF
ncbi:hypothetical protein LEP1GSC050_3758 [Leptospira broomii serovar Hurstbridge str. 5399]|uniref:Uncharacterized protein n=1 Tax=Leptospira broomii serovar Hurstbridge str. 5399 TaxID=1049789 RepID=T0F3J7_9LEPT|nr:hypothetical protein LEP1GSC050_3758 [Leptospira broomii serovar Hurstbridge str. 5399]